MQLEGGDINTPDADDAAAAAAQDTPIATVAMEYSRIEDTGACDNPATEDVSFSDPERVVKFYVFNADGSTLLNNADLDGFGARPIPQLCMVCHGGAYPGGFVVGAEPPFSSRDEVKLGSQFLPFDIHFYTFTTAPFDKAGQQDEFETLNKDVVAFVPSSLPGDTAITDLINGLHPVPGADQDENFVVTGWNAQPLEQQMYRDVVARTCRTCHIASPFIDLKFSDSGQAKSRLGAIETRVCAQHVMPHAKRTHDIFWTSVGPHMPGVLQIYGDTFDVAPNDTSWAGNVCGEFTPGGETPESFYHTDIQPIWAANCGGCHIGGAQAGLALDGDAAGPDPSYSNLVEVDSSELPAMKRVKKNSANESYLFHKLEGTHGGLSGCPNIGACFGANQPCGGQMPCGNVLPAQERTTIQNWIESGAPGP